MEKRRPGNGLWRRLFSTLGVRSLETVLAVSGGRVGTFLRVCYDRNLAAARKEIYTYNSEYGHNHNDVMTKCM